MATNILAHNEEHIFRIPDNYLMKTVFERTVKGGRGKMWTSNIADRTWLFMDEAVKKEQDSYMKNDYSLSPGPNMK